MRSVARSFEEEVDLMVAYSQTRTSGIKSCRATVTSESDLLDGCRSGDEAAWAEIVSRYERLVYSIPLRSGLSADDAADVVQLTFAKLVETIDRIEKSESLGSWLMTVARRTTWRVSNRVAREVPTGEPGNDLALEPGDVELVQALMVHEALAQIAEACRDLLRALFAEDEPSYVAVAVRLGRPVGSIGPMRARCLGQLRAELDSATDSEVR